VSSALGLDRLL